MNRTIIFISLIFSFAASYSQNSKFEKWQVPGYFKGYNILYENPKTLQDVIDFKKYGGNLLQIGTWGFFAEDSPYGIVQAHIDGTDMLVDYCRQAGVFYTIAVRSGPGAYDTYQESQGNTGESRIWESANTSERQLYANMLVMMTERYAGDSLFAGLNLVVEPRPKVRYIPANTSALYKYFLENVYHIYMGEVYQFFINEIRSSDAELPLIIENFAYSTPELFPGYEVTDPYIIYDAHLYQPKEYTNAAQIFSQTYPGTYWNITYLSQQRFDAVFMRETVLSKVHDFQITTGAPVILGEFGIMLPQIGTSDYLRDVLQICRDYGWHFALWDWRRRSGMNWSIESFYGPSDPEPWQVVLSFFNPLPSPIGSRTTGSPILTMPPRFKLYDNYPNPFNPVSTIRFEVPVTENSQAVRLSVFDVLGREVEVLVNEQLTAGAHEVTWNAAKYPSGVYFYKLTGYNFSDTKRMILSK